MRVDGWPFKVSKDIYDWLCEGEKVAVDYWARNRKVTRVNKLM